MNIINNEEDENKNILTIELLTSNSIILLLVLVFLYF